MLQCVICIFRLVIVYEENYIYTAYHLLVDICIFIYNKSFCHVIMMICMLRLSIVCEDDYMFVLSSG